MDKWRPIETAPKKIIHTDGAHEYGKHILVWPFYGEVVRAQWWQWRESNDEINGSNFISEGGNACYPTHWMPVPKPPKGEE